MEVDSRSRSSRVAVWVPASWTVISTTPSSRASASIRLTMGRETPSSRAMSLWRWFSR